VNDEIIDEIKHFDGLIDEEAASLLIRERKGELNLPKIEEADGDVSLYAVICSIGEVEKISGKKVVNTVICDETGCCILKLWEEKISNLEKASEGDTIKIIDAYTRDGYYGKEINVGRNGRIEKVEREMICNKNNFIFMEGIVEKIEPTRVFFIGGSERFVASAIIDGKNVKLFNEKIKEIMKAVGKKVEIEWACMKNGEIHITSFSKIKVK